LNAWVKQGSGSGLDADLLDGKHASSSPTANTIPVADNNGYLNSWIKQGSGSGLNADLLRGLPADFTASKTSNGYQKLPSGLIIQWGRFGYPVYPVPTSGSLTVSFPITFPSQVYVVNVGGLVNGAYGSHPGYFWYTNIEDKSKFKFFWHGAPPNTWGYSNHYFIAIGA